METVNPFDAINQQLQQLQASVNILLERTNNAHPPPENDPEKLLDLTEAAAVVKRPVATMRYYIHHRNLPATKIGKSYLIKLNELLNWFNAFAHKTAEKASGLSPMLRNRLRYRKK